MWEAEAAVWIAAKSEGVPGLVVVAESLEALAAKFRVLILNCSRRTRVPPLNGDEFPFSLIARDRAYHHAA